MPTKDRLRREAIAREKIERRREIGRKSYRSRKARAVLQGVPLRDSQHHAETSRKSYHRRKELRESAALGAAIKRFLARGTLCVAYYRDWEEPPDPSHRLDAQQLVVKRAVDDAEAKLLASFNEPETRRGQHPGLVRAIKVCQLRSATLLIAKVAKLASSTRVRRQLWESGISFFACDNPNFNHEKIEDLAIEAQLREKRRRDKLSATWKDKYKNGQGPKSSATARARSAEGARRGAEAGKKKADAFAAVHAPFVELLEQRGATAAQIAAALNALRYPRPKGKEWDTSSVYRLQARVRSFPPSNPAIIDRAEKQMLEAGVAPSPARSSPATHPIAAEAVSAPAPKKRRGPPPVLRQKIIDRIQAEISAGSLTREQLAGFDEEALAVRYGASRDTVRYCRNVALSL